MAISITFTMKILQAETSSIYFPVLESRNITSENPFALAWACARKTYREKQKGTETNSHDHLVLNNAKLEK